jgi:predicted nucleotidyltransferase component of viral defense system
VATGQLFNEVLQHYALERLLFRLSKSDQVGRFVLKGALLLRVWGLTSVRATRDIDLLGQTSNEAGSISAIIQDVCTIAVEDDGLVFDAESVKVAQIAGDAEYEGLRVQFEGRLGNARIPMQIDIGFGDPITPAPVVTEYPTVLGMEAPRIRVYPPETAIAEKFQVMLYRGLLNSRMKDYFDVWALARSRRFEGAVLSEAILLTCESRGTAVVPSPVALSEEALLDADKQVQWMAFRRRIIPTAAPESFSEVVREVAAFLQPVAEALAAGVLLSGHWAPGGPWS